jgi:hypothetical protein
VTVAAGEGGRVVVRLDGVEGRLFHNHKGRLVTDHPLLRRFGERQSLLIPGHQLVL